MLPFSWPLWSYSGPAPAPLWPLSGPSLALLKSSACPGPSVMRFCSNDLCEGAQLYNGPWANTGPLLANAGPLLATTGQKNQVCSLRHTFCSMALVLHELHGPLQVSPVSYLRCLHNACVPHVTDCIRLRVTCLWPRSDRQSFANIESLIAQ